ncbi:MAG: nitroreductase family protein [Candidatus Aminicenantes bacterium]|nr:MAG: nitroreductase family protein [Candidatus Aminicenantes bacterium]
MDFCEAIEKRRSVRKFLSPASQEQLNRILNAGTKAPSEMNTQQWEFVVVDDPELIEKISEIKYMVNRDMKPRWEDVPPEKEKIAQMQKDSFPNASLVLVFYPRNRFNKAAGWACIQNMLLAAASEGLGSRIATIWGRGEKEVARLLKVPKGFELVAAISIGMPAYTPGPKPLRPVGTWLHRNVF